MEKVDVAVVGADSAAGEALLEALGAFPLGQLHLLAHGEGAPVELDDQRVDSEPLDDFDFGRVRVVFFAGEPALAANFAQRAADAGTLAIDLGPHFRDDADVPMVAAAINPEDLPRARERGIVCAPDALSLQLLRILKPLHDAAGVVQASATCLVAAAVAGKLGIAELGEQTADLLNFRDVNVTEFARRIAFNAVPQCGALLPDGRSALEAALTRDVHKILGDERILVVTTCVQVPVFHGNSLALQVRTREDVSGPRELLTAAGLRAMDGDDYPTSATQAGSHEVIVGRIREIGPRELMLWSVADGLWVAAANAVDCAGMALRDSL